MPHNDIISVPVRILNGEYNIRCPSNRLDDLIEASQYLDEKMRKTREESDIMSIDRIAIITALNIMREQLDLYHELLHQRQLNDELASKLKQYVQKMNKRIQEGMRN